MDANEQQLSDSPQPPPRHLRPQAQRRWVRFPVMVRIDYEVDGRRTFNFTSDLSGGGAFLRGARKLTVGQELDLEIVLKEIDVTQTVRAVVRRVVGEGSDGGVALEFLPHQNEASDTIRNFIRDQQLPKLESRVERSKRSPGPVIALATYYAELGRTEDTFALYREACEISQPDIQILEAFGHFLFQRVRVDGAIDEEIMTELEAVLDLADEIETSNEIAHIRTEADLLRRQLDRHDRERRDQHERERRQKEREERERLAEATRAEALVVAQRELAGEIETLESKHRAEVNAVSADLHETRGRLREVEPELERSRNLAAETARERDELATTSAASIAGLEGRLETLTSERVRLETQCGELEDLGGQQRAAIDTARVELEDTHLRLQELERDLQQSRELAADNAQARIDITEQSAEAVTDLENRLATSAKERLRVEVICNELEDVKSALEQRCDLLEETTRGQEAHRGELEDAQRDLEERLTTVTGERRDLATRCEEIEATVAAKATDYGQETEELKATVARLGADAARATESEESLRHALSLAETHGDALRAAQQELAEVRTELQDARQGQRIADKVQRGAARVGRQLGEARRRHQATEARVAELEGQLDHERREGTRLQTELESAHAAGEATAKASGEELERLRAARERAEGEAHASSEALATARAEAAAQSSPEREAERENERALVDQIQRLEELLAQLRSGLSDSDGSRAQIDEAIGRLEAERTTLNGQLDDSITTAADGQRRLVDLVGGLEQLRDELQQPLERLEGLSEKLDRGGDDPNGELGEALRRATEREEAFAQLTQRLEGNIEQSGAAWGAARELVEQGVSAVEVTRRTLEEQQQRFDENAATLSRHQQDLAEARARVDEWLASLATERQANREQLEADRAAVNQQIVAERESWQAYLEQVLAHQNTLFQEERDAAVEREQELRAWIDQAMAAFEAQATNGASPVGAGADANQATGAAAGSEAKAEAAADAAADLPAPGTNDDAASPAPAERTRPTTGPIPAPPKRSRPTTGPAPEPPIFPQVVSVPEPNDDPPTLATVTTAPPIKTSTAVEEASATAGAGSPPMPAPATGVPQVEASSLVEVADDDIVALSADTARGRVPPARRDLRHRLMALSDDPRARVVGLVVLVAVLLTVLVVVVDTLGDGPAGSTPEVLADDGEAHDRPTAEAEADGEEPITEAGGEEPAAEGPTADTSTGETPEGSDGATTAAEEDGAAPIAEAPAAAPAPSAALERETPPPTPAATPTSSAAPERETPPQKPVRAPSAAPERETSPPKPVRTPSVAPERAERPTPTPPTAPEPKEEAKSLEDLFDAEFD